MLLNNMSTVRQGELLANSFIFHNFRPQPVLLFLVALRICLEPTWFGKKKKKKSDICICKQNSWSRIRSLLLLISIFLSFVIKTCGTKVLFHMFSDHILAVQKMQQKEIPEILTTAFFYLANSETTERAGCITRKSCYTYISTFSKCKYFCFRWKIFSDGLITLI